MRKVIEQLKEQFKISENKLFSPTASPYLVAKAESGEFSLQPKDLINTTSPILSDTDSEQMFQKEVKDFAY